MSSQSNSAPRPVAMSTPPVLAPATARPETIAPAPAARSPPKTSSQKTTETKKQPSAGAGADLTAAAKITKRRAARACVSCRARKVRCDVVEGAPCGNCRWDNVECVVQESRRRKKNIHQLHAANAGAAAARHVPSAEVHHGQPTTNAGVRVDSISSSARLDSISSSVRFGSISSSTPPAISPSCDAPILLDPNPASPATGTANLFVNDGLDSRTPHLTYPQPEFNSTSTDESSRLLLSSLLNQVALLGNPQFPSVDDLDQSNLLPPFICVFPAKISSQDIRFLREKGAASLPGPALQNALLQAYVEYVHPYMPLLDIQDFLATVNARDGSRGQVSLFLYQAVMFAATAFVDMKALREAGFTSRKAARKAFFQKARLLYDFDYESDRLVLVQGLLLKTFWYESPDDQKDTWHWMGVAISLAHTIGLHRNPMSMRMPERKQRLWKRIWWSCFMRDRLIALGMRRPTRIKDEDFDVPMLEKSDFDIEVLPEDNTLVPPNCAAVRDLTVQEELAELCIAKAQLCILVSRMLKAQYSVLTRDKMRPDDTTNSTMMLFPNKGNNVELVKTVDLELMTWESALHECCQYRPITPLDVRDGRSTLAIHRTLLHMVYHSTVSALHRPQFLPASPAQAMMASRPVQEMARIRVRDAAARITLMAADLHRFKLERYLPTTGVTVVLPAMIIHLLDMRNPVQKTRERAMKGFKQCMRVMEKLRDIYAAADYAASFLDAALRKASIDLSQGSQQATAAPAPAKYQQAPMTAHTPPPDNVPYMTAPEASLYTSSYGEDNRPITPVMATAAEFGISATSPPHTEHDDFDSASYEMTPSTSGASEEMNVDFDLARVETMDSGCSDTGGLGIGAGEVNGVTDMDMDQWLQFPPEGVNDSDDTFMAGMFSSGDVEQGLSWAFGNEGQAVAG
ncbi:related to cutinase transcription factor 1 beta [Cephalotrichum gorgonifer]|uniref:Related to cutinase transcription factor 1 beta n=1 Tax=Cephalotrichum gorgonifer TaxID=2041049 RepID=A0AAE8MVT8_9PEZI|nr:related to cutinase transcription factor 1 beta [Cephalotrichum gorgonifer]